MVFYDAFEIAFEITAALRMTTLFRRLLLSVSGVFRRVMGEGVPKNTSGIAILN